MGRRDRPEPGGADEEVEALEAFDRWEVGRADPALHHLPLALDQLQLGQAQEIADVIDALHWALDFLPAIKGLMAGRKSKA